MFAQKLKPGMIWQYVPPVARHEKDPEIDFAQYEDFTVFPQAELIEEPAMSPIVEKQLLFMLRNHFELLGYRYVSSPDDADFVVAICYSNPGFPI